jgi:hypothetical protein
MNTKTLSNRAMSIIDQYEKFHIENAICSVPYFNNKTRGSRLALRAYIGKGSPEEIYDETLTIILKNRMDPKSLSDSDIKKILTDKNIGIDCSGYVYHILNAEFRERGLGTIDKHIHFTECSGVLGKIKCSLRPVENCGVKTFANNKNSKIMSIKDIQPGDLITMLDNENGVRDHVLIIKAVDYQNFIPTKIYYSHAIAYPEDGIYGTGIKNGMIEIVDINKPITDQHWSATNNSENTMRLLDRARTSLTEIRHLQSLI